MIITMFTVYCYNSVVVNSHINSNSIVLGFSGKPLELLNIAKVKRY